MRFLTLALSAMVTFATSACGSQNSQPAPAATAAPAPAVAAPEPLTFGQHHHPIRTSNAEAQRMFDQGMAQALGFNQDRKSTRLNSSHSQISYAVFCLKKKKHTAHKIHD